jgi:hypothetical protein
MMKATLIADSLQQLLSFSLTVIRCRRGGVEDEDEATG